MKLCNMCHSSENEPFFNVGNIHGKKIISKRESFQYYLCLNCRNIFLGNLNINQKFYKKYYPTSYYKKIKKNILYFFLEIIGLYSYPRKAGFITNHSKNRKKISILDVGSGDAYFLKKLDDNKFDKTGIDIGIKTSDRSIKIIYSDFLHYKFNRKKFDAITMWHVLEHFEKPELAVKKVRQLLNRGGVFVFTVPNSLSLGFRIGKKLWYHLDPPRHLFIPNEMNISRLLIENGFTIISVKNEFYDYPLDLFWSVRKSVWRFVVYFLYPFFKMFDKECLTFICEKNDL